MGLVYGTGVWNWCMELVYETGVWNWCMKLVYIACVRNWSINGVYAAEGLVIPHTVVLLDRFSRFQMFNPAALVFKVTCTLNAGISNIYARRYSGSF